jgi:hypothetical protein
MATVARLLVTEAGPEPDVVREPVGVVESRQPWPRSWIASFGISGYLNI